MSNIKNCGSCAHWDHENKRNVSNPETPIYYAECKYSVDNLKLPSCISFDEMPEVAGEGCPCFELHQI